MQLLSMLINFNLFYSGISIKWLKRFQDIRKHSLITRPVMKYAVNNFLRKTIIISPSIENGTHCIQKVCWSLHSEDKSNYYNNNFKVSTIWPFILSCSVDIFTSNEQSFIDFLFL